VLIFRLTFHAFGIQAPATRFCVVFPFFFRLSRRAIDLICRPRLTYGSTVRFPHSVFRQSSAFFCPEPEWPAQSCCSDPRSCCRLPNLSWGRLNLKIFFQVGFDSNLFLVDRCFLSWCPRFSSRSCRSLENMVVLGDSGFRRRLSLMLSSFRSPQTASFPCLHKSAWLNHWRGQAPIAIGGFDEQFFLELAVIHGGVVRPLSNSRRPT